MIANIGYPKSLLETLALPFLAAVPLHVVCVLERELARGFARQVYRIVTSNHQTLAIPGAVIVRPSAASIVFGTVTIWWISVNAHLLENLKNGPYYGLFLQLGIVRVAIGLLMLFAVLAWYISTLNDLKQHALEQMRAKGRSAQ
jgi:hypothetical protein